MVKETNPKAWWFLTRLFIGLLFGVLFFFLAEICQSSLTTFEFSCCERCSNYLYDQAQPVLAVCATLACFLYLWKCPPSVSLKKSLLFAITFSWISFLGYLVFMAIHIYRRTECTALYSPGPGFMHSVAFGGPLVMIFLLIESSFWSVICLILLLMMGVISRVFRPHEQAVSIFEMKE